MGHQKPHRNNLCAAEFLKMQNIGPSPSGKATDFDSVIRGFEARRPSHKGYAKKIIHEKARFYRAFSRFEGGNSKATAVLFS